MPIEIITTSITIQRLQELAKEKFGDMIKAVVDVERGIMAIGAQLHSDEEKLLLEQGSKQADLWGINLWPQAAEDQFVEFDSMINLRPWMDNKSRSVESAKLRDKIISIVKKLVKS